MLELMAQSGERNAVSPQETRTGRSPAHDVAQVLTIGEWPDGSAVSEGDRLDTRDFNAALALSARPLPHAPGAAAALDDRARSRRLLAVLRFLTHLRDSEDEDQILHTVLQAAAVWYDAEACAYRRDGSGTFVLDNWLPGVDISVRPRALPPSVVSTLRDGPTIVSSPVELEEVGWRDAPGDIVLMPVTYGGRHQWIIAVGGALDEDAEAMATLAAVRVALGAVLQRRVDRDAAALRDRLRGALHHTGLTDSDVTASMLQTLMKHAGAANGRLRIEAEDGGVTLAESVSHESADGLAARESDVDRCRLSLPLEAGRSLTLELDGSPDVSFRPSALAAVEAAAPVVQGWLDSAARGVRDAEPETVTIDFERRIDEEVVRARRFGLELVVLLIASGAAEMPTQAERALRDAVRSDLRGSDLVGTIGRGEIAVVLVHTGAHGAHSVEERLKNRLQTVLRERKLPSITLGEGGFPAGGDSAAALLSRARSQQTIFLDTMGGARGV